MRPYKYTKITILAFLLLAAAGASAFVRDLQDNLQELTAGLSENAGVEVVSLDKRDVLFSKNADTPLNPASVVKVLTSAAALKYLGADFRFHTYFYKNAGGDLIVRGEGDPSVVIEELEQIAGELKRKDACPVRNILIDDTYFSSYTQPGLTGDKVHYNSYTGALSLNFNRTIINFSPGKRVGDPATVKVDTGGPDIEFINEVKTAGRGGGAYINLEPPTGDQYHFVVRGQIPIGYKSRRVEKHVNIPPLYFAEALTTLLKENGCRVVGEIYRAGKDKGMRLVLDHASKPLSEIVSDMNKFSNNFIAEQLVKVLGAKFVGAPGATDKGIEVFKKYLSGLGVPPNSYHLVNGSGLSYDNRISADTFLKIIYDMYRDKRLWSAFYESLSIAGTDGTLKRRYRRTLLHGRLHAKTGTVNFVRAVAGVLPSADGEMFAYVILMNGSENTRISRKVRDDTATAIAEFKR